MSKNLAQDKTTFTSWCDDELSATSLKNERSVSVQSPVRGLEQRSQNVLTGVRNLREKVAPNNQRKTPV